MWQMVGMQYVGFEGRDPTRRASRPAGAGTAAAAAAVKPSIRLCGKGHGWEEWYATLPRSTSTPALRTPQGFAPPTAAFRVYGVVRHAAQVHLHACAENTAGFNLD